MPSSPGVLPRVQPDPKFPMVSVTSQMERLINDVYTSLYVRYTCPGREGTWSQRPRGKHCSISPANSFDLHYAGLSYKNATATKKNQNLSEKKGVYYFN